MHNACQIAFVKSFKEISPHENRYSIFHDWVTMSAISIHNAVIKDPALEERYLSIAGKYSRSDLEKIAKLLALLIQGLEDEPCDFLGSIFMDLELGNKYTAQFFTPYQLSLAIAKVQVGDAVKLIRKKGFIKVSEPSCGAGGMIIAFAQALIEQGINPQEALYASCIDVDPVAAYMCYLQLSLLGLPCEVIIGNTLTMDFNEVLRTPFYYFGNWAFKLNNIPSVESHMEVKEVAIPSVNEQISLLDFA